MAAAKAADKEKAAAEEAKAKLRAQSRQKTQPGKPKKGARTAIWEGVQWLSAPCPANALLTPHGRSYMHRLSTPAHYFRLCAGTVALSASQPTISQTFLRKGAARAPVTAPAPVTADAAPHQGHDTTNAAAAASTPGMSFHPSFLSGMVASKHRRPDAASDVQHRRRLLTQPRPPIASALHLPCEKSWSCLR